VSPQTIRHGLSLSLAQGPNAASHRELVRKRPGALAGGADRPGIKVRDFGAALVATIVIAIVNATIGPVLKFLTFPLRF